MSSTDLTYIEDRIPSRWRDDNFRLFGLFILWPVLLLVESIRNYRAQYARNALLLFIVFFGYTFIARDGNDAFRYIEWFHDIRDTNISFGEFARLLYSVDTNYVDVVEPFLAFIVAQFTRDHRILFAVFGLMFGYFYTRNVWYLIDRTPLAYSVQARILLVAFAMVIPFWSLNVIRFWTAAHIFFFGAIRFLLEGKTRALWIAAASVLVHFSFVIPVSVLLLYWAMGNRTTAYLTFFLACNLVSEINVKQLREPLIAHTPAAFHNRIEGYTEEENLERRREGLQHRNWYVNWYQRALHIAMSILLTLIFFLGGEVWRKQKEMQRLFSFLLLFGGFATLSSLVPVLMRFHELGMLFGMAFLFLYFYKKKGEILTERALNLLLPAFALFFIVSLRAGFDNASIYSIISNPIIAPAIEINDVTLIDLIKGS